MKKITYDQLCFLLILILSLFSSLGTSQNNFTAQKERKNNLSILFGYHVNNNQDQVYSPMVYTGASAAAIATYFSRHTKNGLHRLGFSYDKMEVESTKLISSQAYGFGRNRKRVPSEASQININYGYVHHLRSHGKLDFSIGGMLESKAHLITYNFGFGDREGFVLANSIQPWLINTYAINDKSKLRSELRLPLLSWVSRPDYSIVDNQDLQNEGSDTAYAFEKGGFSSWGNYQAVDFSIAYVYAISESADFTIGYRLDYLRYEKPQKIIVVKNNFDFGFLFKF